MTEIATKKTTASIPIQTAARILLNDGVVAYPTEGAFGLGCLPGSPGAVARILSMKKRDPGMGLVLIAATLRQLDPWIDRDSIERPLESSAERPVTWIVPASADLPYWISGDHSGVAVRLVAHPIAAALCEATDSALVSTSANRSGQPPARNQHVLRRHFGDLVDFVVPGALGPARGPSEIRRYDTGKTLRSVS